MSWLNYSDDEVRQFHLEFNSAAEEALFTAHLDGSYEWVHHLRTPGSDLIPDFVLQQRNTGRWLAAVEIKRKIEAVHSTRNQIQAKAYAEANQDRFVPNRAKYFAISNLEDTIVFALNGDRPPRECRLHNGLFTSGRFDADTRDEHRQGFVEDLLLVLDILIKEPRPLFDMVWPGVLSDFVLYSATLPYIPDINISEPRTPYWDLVRDYFADSLPAQSSRIFILRCLMAEYLRGILSRYNHPRASALPALQSRQAAKSAARAIEAIRQIDFRGMFADSESDIYRNLTAPDLLEHLNDYIERITITERKIVDLARDRIDSPELLDSLTTSLYPVEVQDERGKVTTDPELAALLAYVTIDYREAQVIDPCCGDGVLLSAAYDRLLEFGLEHDRVISALDGIEADPISARLASVRLALKQPTIVSPTPEVSITYGDMFANPQKLGEATVVLMNPPFKRYEAQDLRPVPLELRSYYDQSIAQLDRIPSATTSGQANLYSFYVEFVGKAVRNGARLGIILDNKWYHNTYSRELRRFLLRHFEIEAIIEYPHSVFFADWTIATSVLVVRKTGNVDDNHEVMFIRSKVDPRSVDLNSFLAAYQGGGSWPLDWTCRIVLQRELDARSGWKQYFAQELKHDFRLAEWPTLDNLFEHSRRGSLEKEGGGIGVLEFPFERAQYGPRRQMKARPRRRYQTESDRPLAAQENELLAQLSASIPADFRGLALRNSDTVEKYELTAADVTVQETLEPPILRGQRTLFEANRSPWTRYHDLALEEMRNDPRVNAFLEAVENIVNLSEAVLPREELWNVLREPTAGELIIPRKTRQGHRVHINRYAFDLEGRQVRISSNFVTYKGCVATSPNTGLDRQVATYLIAAFLVSSFGQLQFEIEGYNREGLLALEKTQLNRIRVFDPRWIRPVSRPKILEIFGSLPYPIPTDRLSYEQGERNLLDRLFAEEICARFSQFEVDLLLNEVHAALDEWLIARQP